MFQWQIYTDEYECNSAVIYSVFVFSHLKNLVDKQELAAVIMEISSPGIYIGV